MCPAVCGQIVTTRCLPSHEWLPEWVWVPWHVCQCLLPLLLLLLVLMVLLILLLHPKMMESSVLLLALLLKLVLLLDLVEGC